jgi:hypothetical protein
MKKIGIVIASISALCLLLALNMSTTVTTEAKTFGDFKVPSMTVNNLGLMQSKQNYINVSAVFLILGVGIFLLAPKNDSKKSKKYNKCPFCAEEVANDAIKCKHCGSDINREKLSETFYSMSGTVEEATERTGLSEYYLNAFKIIDANNGGFTRIFNWAAFLFGALWYLYKGMWAKGLIMLVIGFLLAGLPFLFFSIYCAIAGTYDYYLLTVKKKQLW